MHSCKRSIVYDQCSYKILNYYLLIVKLVGYKCVVLTHSFVIDFIFYTYECLLEIIQTTQHELSTRIFSFSTLLGLIIGRRWYWWSQKMNIMLQCLYKSLKLYQQFPYWTTIDILPNLPIGFKKYVRNKLKIFQMFKVQCCSIYHIHDVQIVVWITFDIFILPFRV